MGQTPPPPCLANVPSFALFFVKASLIPAKWVPTLKSCCGQILYWTEQISQNVDIYRMMQYKLNNCLFLTKLYKYKFSNNKIEPSNLASDQWTSKWRWSLQPWKVYPLSLKLAVRQDTPAHWPPKTYLSFLVPGSLNIDICYWFISSFK